MRSSCCILRKQSDVSSWFRGKRVVIIPHSPYATLQVPGICTETSVPSGSTWTQFDWKRWNVLGLVLFSLGIRSWPSRNKRKALTSIQASVIRSIFNPRGVCPFISISLSGRDWRSSCCHFIITEGKELWKDGKKEHFAEKIPVHTVLKDSFRMQWIKNPGFPYIWMKKFGLTSFPW